MAKRHAMTLLEVVVCLAICAVCLVVMVQGTAQLGVLARRAEARAEVLPAVEALVLELENAPPAAQRGRIGSDWRYETRLENGHYTLTVSHAVRDERYDFVLCEAAP